MSKRQKRNLFRIAVSVVIFAVSFLLKKWYPADTAITFFAYLVSGYDVVFSAVRKIFSFRIFDEEILMTAATVCAMVLGEVHEAAAVMILYQTGELFQGIAVGKSRRSIKEMLKLRPEAVNVLRDSEVVNIKPENVNKGEIILVLPGEKVAIDGIIEEGYSSFDASSLTGESMPVYLEQGNRVASGVINLERPVKIRTETVYEESTVAKILDIVESSSQYKSVSEKFITKFSRKYTPCVFVSALLTFLIPTVFLGMSYRAWLKRALVFLIVSCPCALVISVPLSFFCAIGAASRKGVLIKGSEYIETLSKTKIMAFDKTGTVTEGKFRVSEIKKFSESEEKILETAAYAESFSNHPIANAVIEKYGKIICRERIKNAETIPGRGIAAKIDGEEVLVGNKAFLQENKISVPRESEHSTAVYVACGGKTIGVILLEDYVKKETAESMKKLKKAGIKRLIMLTGDNDETAAKVGKEINADEIYSRLLPADKVTKVLELKKSAVTAFAGDGINDAPVLSCVDVGFAMGSMGSDAAVEAADIVIMNDDFSAVPETVILAKKTMNAVRQNIILSLAVKFGVMAFSLSGFANMYAAIFADVGVMVIAVLNACRKR